MSAVTPFLQRIAAGATLDGQEMAEAMNILLSGEASQVEIAGFLMGLRARGETIEEIAAAATAMRDLALAVDAPTGAIDTCGTGGDDAHTYNISTAVAFVVAGAGVPVAKHGNRAASSKSGSSDVLEALGVKLDIAPAQISKCMHEANIGFMFAALHHKAVANVAPVRKELSVRTLFNVLGPLSNPAQAKRQLMGVFDKSLIVPIAEVLGRLGLERAWVVHGSDGLDELTTTGPTSVASLENNIVTTFEVRAGDAGLKEATLEDLRGGAPEENADAIRRLLDGETGPYRDIVLLNAAAALIVAEKASDLREGATLAAQSIDQGAAKAALAGLVKISNEPT